MSNYNPIDDPEEFPEYFPKPVFYYIEPYSMYTFKHLQHHIISPGMNYIEGYYPETIATPDTVAPSTWAWFKSLWGKG